MHPIQIERLLQTLPPHVRSSRTGSGTILVYVVEKEPSGVYVGVTATLRQRLLEHNTPRLLLRYVDTLYVFECPTAAAQAETMLIEVHGGSAAQHHGNGRFLQREVANMHKRFGCAPQEHCYRTCKRFDALPLVLPVKLHSEHSLWRPYPRASDVRGLCFCGSRAIKVRDRDISY